MTAAFVKDAATVEEYVKAANRSDKDIARELVSVSFCVSLPLPGTTLASGDVFMDHVHSSPRKRAFAF